MLALGIGMYVPTKDRYMMYGLQHLLPYTQSGIGVVCSFSYKVMIKIKYNAE